MKLAIKALLFNFCLWWAAMPSLEAADKSFQSVEITIKTISASKQGNEFDPQLAALEKQLKALNYGSYRLLKQETQTARWQGNANFQIPGGRMLTVRPQEVNNDQLGLRVQLKQGDKPQLETTVRLNNRGNFILGGPRHDNGVLVLSISATAR
ncbi:MAG: hypothetical protein OEN50_03740 [Deltaproteobacteria bacterium]|nr:hypothetical protein [Deltaproteobacteria bacterium]